MNDEKDHTLDPKESVIPSDDPPPEAPEKATETANAGDDTQAPPDESLPESLPKASEDPPFFEDSRSDSDPVASDVASTTAEERLEQLRGELNTLRRELAKKDAYWERLGAECEEFHDLYPEVALSTLPDSVWKDVKRGIPLAAAYALAERKRALTEAFAHEQLLKNRDRSAGEVKSMENDYFSPAEVRAMSGEEVHKNYAKIMKSMQKWH